MLSGFVLSYRSWQLVRASKLEAVFPSLSSSTFRRGFRLFLPTTLATLITMVLIQTGAWNYPAQVAMDETIITAENEYHQARLPTFGAQTAHWASMMWNMTNIFAWEETYPEYDVHLWTIPMEFRASLLLFLILLVLVRLRYRYRVAIRFEAGESWWSSLLAAPVDHGRSDTGMVPPTSGTWRVASGKWQVTRFELRASSFGSALLHSCHLPPVTCPLPAAKCDPRSEMIATVGDGFIPDERHKC